MGWNYLPCLQDCPLAFPDPFGVRKEDGQCLQGLLVHYLLLPAKSPEWLCAQGEPGRTLQACDFDGGLLTAAAENRREAQLAST